MPNHVKNTLSVIGPDADMQRFVAAARGRMPLTGDTLVNADGLENLNADLGKGERPVEDFCFHALVPLPKEYSQVPYSDAGYEMERKIWGVKWGAYAQKSPLRDPGLVTYCFETAWSPCVKLLAKVAPKWPTLTLLLSWGGEGPTRGRARFHGAATADDVIPYRREDYPAEEDFDSEGDENRHHEACEAVTHALRRTHPLWVGDQIALAAGYSFAGDVGALMDWLKDRGLTGLAEALVVVAEGGLAS